MNPAAATPRRSWKQRLVAAANTVLAAADLAVLRASKLRQLRAIDHTARGPSFTAAALPPGAEDYLTATNPRLAELRTAYAAIGAVVTRPSLWTPAYLARELELRAFRGDNPYLWQQREGLTPARLLLSTYYARSVDTLGLLDVLEEDELFGIWSIPWRDGRRHTSRDLVDSVLDILFLHDTLGLAHLDGATVLDIGAGYGRLAHRLTAACPGLGGVLCADAVPESTFVAEYYLRFRGAARARAVPLPALDAELGARRVALAVNVHAFSECPLAAIAWWLDRLVEHRVPALMIVPNTADRLLSLEADGRRLDFAPELARRGYREVARRPKYGDPAVQVHGVAPDHHHFLFARD